MSCGSRVRSHLSFRENRWDLAPFDYRSHQSWVIADENDSERDVHDALESRDLYVHVNIVRYHPPSPAHGAEPPDDVLERNAAISRVGFDVQASCGMFT